MAVVFPGRLFRESQQMHKKMYTMQTVKSWKAWPTFLPEEWFKNWKTIHLKRTEIARVFLNRSIFRKWFPCHSSLCAILWWSSSLLSMSSTNWCLTKLKTTMTSWKSWSPPSNWRAMTLTRSLNIFQSCQTHLSQMWENRERECYSWPMPGSSPFSLSPTFMLTHFRSGSSYVGELLTAGPTSFYFYEPLYALRPKYVNIYNNLSNENHDPSGTIYEESVKSKSGVLLASKYLDSLLSCQVIII